MKGKKRGRCCAGDDQRAGPRYQDRKRGLPDARGVVAVVVMVVVTEAVSSSSLLLRCWVPVIDLIAADNPRRVLTGLGLKRASWDEWNHAWSERSTGDNKLNWSCYSQSAFTCTGRQIA